MAWDSNKPDIANAPRQIHLQQNEEVRFFNLYKDKNKIGGKMKAVASPIAALTKILENLYGANKYKTVPTKAANLLNISRWKRYIEIPEKMKPSKNAIFTLSMMDKPARCRGSAISQGRW